MIDNDDDNNNRNDEEDFSEKLFLEESFIENNNKNEEDTQEQQQQQQYQSYALNNEFDPATSSRSYNLNDIAIQPRIKFPQNDQKNEDSFLTGIHNTVGSNTVFQKIFLFQYK